MENFLKKSLGKSLEESQGRFSLKIPGIPGSLDESMKGYLGSLMKRALKDYLGELLKESLEASQKESLEKFLL